MGCSDFVTSKLKQVVEKIETMLETLSKLKNPHCEFVLLKASFSLLKVSYLARTCPPSSSYLGLWENLDDLIRDSLNEILGLSLSDKSWLQAQILVVKGGLVLLSAFLQSSAAFLSSWSGCQSLMEQLAPELDLSVISTLRALEHLSHALKREEVLPEEVVMSLTQKELSLLINTIDLEHLVESVGNTWEKAHLLSAQMPHCHMQGTGCM